MHFWKAVWKPQHYSWCQGQIPVKLITSCLPSLSPFSWKRVLFLQTSCPKLLGTCLLCKPEHGCCSTNRWLKGITEPLAEALCDTSENKVHHWVPPFLNSCISEAISALLLESENKNSFRTAHFWPYLQQLCESQNTVQTAWESLFFFVLQEKENLVKFYTPFLVMATILSDAQLFLHICFSHSGDGMERHEIPSNAVFTVKLLQNLASKTLLDLASF